MIHQQLITSASFENTAGLSAWEMSEHHQNFQRTIVVDFITSIPSAACLRFQVEIWRGKHHSCWAGANLCTLPVCAMNVTIYLIVCSFSECVCNYLGTVQEHCNGSDCQCDKATGQCLCLPNVVGQNCDRCAPDTWQLASGTGCDPCNCDAAHSFGTSCNEVRCYGRPG